MSSTTRRLGAALAALPLAFALAACGGGEEKKEEQAAPSWKGQEIVVAEATASVPAEWENNTGSVGDIETVFTNTSAGVEPSVALIADARESYKETLDEYADEALTWDEELKTRNKDITVDGVKFFHVSQKANDESGMPAQEFYGAIAGGLVYKFDFTLGEGATTTVVEEIVSTIDFK